MTWQRRYIVKYSVVCPEIQIVSSQEAINRKFRLDPSQYSVETEKILRCCKERRIALKSMKDIGCIEEIYLPNRFSRKYTQNKNDGVPMIGTSSMLNLKIPTTDRIYLNNMKDSEELFVKEGDILVSRSGTVGVTVLCGSSYEGFVASDHCFRLRIKKEFRGYIAAYLISRPGQALLAKNSHGKVIKELIDEDIINLPVMLFDKETLQELNYKMLDSAKMYDKARKLLNEVEYCLDNVIGYIKPKILSQVSKGIVGFTDLIQNRLDPHMYAAESLYPTKEIVKCNHKYLHECAYVSGVPRFKRHYLNENNDNGIGLYSSSDIVRAYLTPSKYISKKLNSKNIETCIVEENMILIPCSGTFGGILGRGVLASKILNGQAVSQHVLRVSQKNSDMNFYYVAAFLCSDNYGYPLITARRFGKDIPEISPESLKDIPIPDIDKGEQEKIGALFYEANRCQEQANSLEAEVISKIEMLFASVMYR